MLFCSHRFIVRYEARVSSGHTCCISSVLQLVQSHLHACAYISVLFSDCKENKKTKRASRPQTHAHSNNDTCPVVPLASPLSVTNRRPVTILAVSMETPWPPKSSQVTPPRWAHKTDPAVVAESWGCFQISVHSEQTVVCQDAVLLVCVNVCHTFTVSSIAWMNDVKDFVVNLKHCGVASMFVVLCSPFCIVCVTWSVFRAGYILCIPQ